jgi:hypothetical protein
LSADYFGEFARQFSGLIDAEATKPAFVAAMTNGTSGDINNINFFEGGSRQQPFEQIRLVAADVAASAQVAYQRVEYQDWVPLRMRETEIELGVRRPDNGELARATKLIEEAGSGPWTDRRLIYANETLDIQGVLVSTPDFMHAPISLAAMHLGKHVFCQKPLTHTVYEARQMQAAAAKSKSVTQMCNQIQSHSAYRTTVHMAHTHAKAQEWVTMPYRKGWEPTWI